MKKFLKIVAILILPCIIAVIAISTVWRKLYWDSIGTKEALKGKGHAPVEVVVESRDFINNKYGIKARAISSQCNFEWGGWDFIIPHKIYDGTYSIEMEYEENRFNVYVNEEGEIKDNYQNEEIQACLQEYISDLIPEHEITIDLEGDLLHDYVYVDTLDMKEYLNVHDSDVIVYVVGTDINDSSFDDIKKLARNVKSNITLTSCRTENDIDTLIALHAPTSTTPEYAMQAESIWCCNFDSQSDTHEECYSEFQLGQYGDLYYTIPDSSKVIISDYNKTVYAVNANVYTLLTPSYKIECNDSVTVFYPVSNSAEVNMEDYKSFKNYGGNDASMIGDYYVYTFYSKQWYEENNRSFDYTDKKIFGIYVRK